MAIEAGIVLSNGPCDTLLGGGVARAGGAVPEPPGRLGSSAALSVFDHRILPDETAHHFPPSDRWADKWQQDAGLLPP
jgi:hypothetical protein